MANETLRGRRILIPLICTIFFFTARVSAETPAATAAAGLQLRSLAATCAACHGTDGHAVAGAALPPLAGLRKEYLVREMRAFREGTRPATVMQQIAKGFNDAQTDALADYFAAQLKGVPD